MCRHEGLEMGCQKTSMYTSKKGDMLKISEPSRERVTRKQTLKNLQ